MICDEIQSGLGRSGKLFAHQWEGIHPDMVIIGKALSGGFYPVSAVLSRKEILGVFKPGDASDDQEVHAENPPDLNGVPGGACRSETKRCPGPRTAGWR